MLEEQNNKSDWAQREIGAFWTKNGAKGKYLSGMLEIDELGVKRKIAVVMFHNRFKDNDKKPDYILFLSKENNNGESKSSNLEDKNTKKDEIPDSLV